MRTKINSINIFFNLFSKETQLHRDEIKFMKKQINLLNISPQGFFSSIERREKGGPVTKGKPYLVGEKGPEVFQPNMSGNIISNENISTISNKTNINSINQSVNSNRVRTVIQPVVETKVKQVPQPVPIPSPSNNVNVRTVSKINLPTDIAKMIS
tara:strand:+ start:741 stop:1205 length:465 start_codon:yes stop_codon:yes gene_type:complete